MMKQNIYISEDLDGKRLDFAVSTQVASCSRSRAADGILKGQILVNSCPRKPGYKVKHGDHIFLDIQAQDDCVLILPEEIALDIIYEDPHLIIINKSAGVVVHPAPGNMSNTLVNALLSHAPEIKKAGDDHFRSGIVHRLDKDTSGLMVVAKNQTALTFLQKEFKQRRVEKRYLALVSGQMSESGGVIDLPIGRHPVKRQLMAVNHNDGKSAVTCWEIKQQYKNACLVQVLLKTGRTHQIRVHFYAMDHPLIGDQVYQPRRFRKQKSMAQRQMLHSWKLSFRHPYSGKRVSFAADPPRDFIKIQSLLEKD